MVQLLFSLLDSTVRMVGSQPQPAPGPTLPLHVPLQVPGPLLCAIGLLLQTLDLSLRRSVVVIPAMARTQPLLAPGFLSPSAELQPLLLQLHFQS